MNPGLRLANVGLLGAIAAAAGFTPPDLSNLVFWGKPDTIGGSDGDLISSFLDSSGLNNHATSSGSNRPTLKKAIVGSHDILRFDGTDDNMAWGNIFSGATSGEAIIVLKAFADPAGSLATSALWYLAQAGGVGDATHPFIGGQIFEHFGCSSQNQGISPPSTSAAFHIYGVHTSTSKMIQWWNGAMFWGLNKFTSIGFPSAPKLCLNNGASATWKGDIAEIFFYKTVLSGGDRKLIHDYLAAKYSITITDPTTAYSPSSFSGMQAWFKADQIGGLNDGDPVSTWADQSGNANDATASLTVRPTYKTGIFNSLPAVRFDGSNDSLILNSNIGLTGALTCMFVGQPTGDNGALFGNNTSGSQIRVRRAGVNEMNFYTGGSEITSGTGWNYALGDLNFYVCTRDGSNNVRWYQGPQQKGTQTAGGTFNNAYVGTPAGAGLIFKGDVGEVVIYNQALTPYNIAQLYYGYFRDKWGLP